MEVPESFGVGLPQSWHELTHPSWASWDGDEELPVPGHWVEMRGGPLPAKIAVRIDRADDGRFIITGLVVGLHDRRELTWETLRAIQPSTLLGYLFDGFDPNDPAKQVAESNVLQVREVGPDFDARAWMESDEDDEDDGEPILVGGPEWNRFERNQSAFAVWQAVMDQSMEEPDERPVEPVLKPRTRIAADLVAFAEVYRRHLATSPRRATQATADELFISRATALRRVHECQKLGLLPRRKEGSK